MEEVAFLCLYTVTLVGNVQRVCWFHHFSHDGNKITLQILINDVSLWCFTQQSCAVILPLCIALEMEIFTFIGIDKGRKPNEVQKIACVNNVHYHCDWTVHRFLKSRHAHFPSVFFAYFYQNIISRRQLKNGEIFKQLANFFLQNSNGTPW